MAYYNNDLNKMILKGIKMYSTSTLPLSTDNIIRHQYTYTNNLNIINDYIRENQNEEVYVGHYYDHMSEEDMFKFLQDHRGGLNKYNLKELRDKIIKDATALSDLPIKFTNYEPECTYDTFIHTENGTIPLGEDKFRFYYYNKNIVIDNGENTSMILLPKIGCIIEVSCRDKIMEIKFTKK